MESIIPTPSIDQVLKNLASNALSSTSAPDSEEDGKEQGREDVVNLSDDSESEKEDDKNNKTSKQVVRPTKRKFALDQSRLNIIMDKNRSAYLRGKFQQQQQNGSRQIYRINTSTNKQSIQKPYQSTASTSTSTTRYAPKTVSEMLNDLVTMSVDKTMENLASLQEHSPKNNNLRFVPATPQESSLILAPPQLEPEENVSESNRSSAVSLDGSDTMEVLEESTSNYQQERQSSSDDDIQFISDDNNVGEVQETQQEESEVVGSSKKVVATPFCKNCASEVPLIIKRLDRLDGMVDKMIKLVKNSLANPANH
uniref:Uncharacterized protein n=1 Tax=Meloidogyne hapla TaxID=6305 RepID=A0A1I8AYE7_MELHA